MVRVQGGRGRFFIGKGRVGEFGQGRGFRRSDGLGGLGRHDGRLSGDLRLRRLGRLGAEHGLKKRPGVVGRLETADQPSLAHDQDLVAQFLGLGQFVGHQDHDAAVAGREIAQDAEQDVLLGRRDARGGLIEIQKPRVVVDKAGQFQLLALGHREPGDRIGPAEKKIPAGPKAR
jgi:hypothetical protein